VRATTSLVDEVCRLGRDAGLDAVGVAPATPFESTRRDLETRKAAGLHGGMHFTYGRPDRSTDPGRTVTGARALVVGARSYAAPTPPAPTGGPMARVARYSRTDHYAELRAALQAVADHLTAAGWRARVLVDDNALVDREAARRAGIGWYGKNSNVLLPGRGSWFVLGAVVTDAPLEPTAVDVPDQCGACTRCMTGCPTDAIVAPGVVDARRCLAWLLQADGPFPVEFRQALGDRIYGCDDCQEVCPPNRRVDERGPAGQAWVDVLELLELSDEDLLARYGRWYIPKRDPRYLRRNALVVLGNTGDGGDPRVRATLGRYLDGDDDLLREHAAWAAAQLQG
jgi:epoxyqueuosine reductase